MIANTNENYKMLEDVLNRAYDQASEGKGKERHADDKPFEDQPILVETRSVGIGFPAGQARKKVLEATRCWEKHPDRAIKDLLGAINYIAAEIIYIEEQKGRLGMSKLRDSISKFRWEDEELPKGGLIHYPEECLINKVENSGEKN